MQEITLPDGSVVEFPDGMAQDAMLGVIKRHSTIGGILHSIMNPQFLEKYRIPVGEIMKDILPVISQQRSLERIKESSNMEGKTPIGKILSGAEIALEGAGLVADVVPGLKAGAIAVGSLASLAKKFKPNKKFHQIIDEVQEIRIDNIKQSEFGQIIENPGKVDLTTPIEVSLFADGSLKISDGHHRLLAAKQLGIEKLPVKLQAINAKGKDITKLIETAPTVRKGSGVNESLPIDETTYYHGTRPKDAISGTPDITEFKTTTSGAAEGVYLTVDPNNASMFTKSQYGGGAVYPVNISGKIGTREDMLKTTGSASERTKQMQVTGLDGYYDEVHKEMVIFDPKNIRFKFTKQ